MACLHAHVLSVIVCLRATCLVCLRAYVLACLASLHDWRAYVHSRLLCSRGYVFTRLACLLVLFLYVLTCLTCLLCSNNLCAYVLACFFEIICPIFFTFQKLVSKNPHIEKSLFIQKVFRTHLNIYDGVFGEKELKVKSVSLFSQKGSILYFRLSFTFILSLLIPV